MRNGKLSREAYERAQEIRRIGNRAVRKAQEESRRLGVPNVYSKGGTIYYERPDGSLTTEDPYEEWQRFIKEPDTNHGRRTKDSSIP